MIVKDVNNYIGIYSNTDKAKLKGCFEIYKEAKFFTEPGLLKDKNIGSILFVFVLFL